MIGGLKGSRGGAYGCFCYVVDRKYVHTRDIQFIFSQGRMRMADEVDEEEDHSIE